MNGDFIKRSLRVSIIVTLLFVPFLFLYLGHSLTLGFITGAVWNILNVYLLSQAITRLAGPAKPDRRLGILAGLLKFPGLYVLGYAILRYTNVSLYGIMAGFSVMLIVFALKALGIYLQEHLLPGNKSYGSSA
ncbi:MAG: hypothetical protein HZC13_00905 [Nitrospirae bacterium]|nr:hypothetical protein [Nitrospirota bacterium]MBI5096355.1 hypothetical protein [Nitrospirota bacterium]